MADLLRTPLAEAPRELALVPLPGPFHVEVTPPGSKSVTNRALLFAALADGESTLTSALLDADDAQVMIEALRQLGVQIEIDDVAAGVVRINGRAGRFKGGRRLDLHNAGTATRFLTAAACLADAPVEIDGNARMRQRPLGQLIEMLRAIGVHVEELGAPGRVPVRVHPLAHGRETPTLTIGRTASSQFVSAMLMIAPLLPRGVRIVCREPLTSPAYVDLTLAMMGAWLERPAPRRPEAGASISVPPGAYTPQRYSVEPDASGATYFWGAAAVVAGSSVRSRLDDTPSIQADAAFGRLVKGFERGGEIDMSLMPDAALTLATVACFASGPTTITGLRTLRVKETDRLAALKAELEKIGVAVEIFSCTGPDGAADEGLRITPPAPGVDCSPRVPRVVFETYDDHRMAMSLAIIGLRRPNVVIKDPQCVGKTYSGFWRDWAKLYQSAATGKRAP